MGIVDLYILGYSWFSIVGLPWWLSLEGSTWNAGDLQGMKIRSLGWEDPLEKEMATHSSILAWEIPWTEEPAGLQSMGSQVRHDLGTKQQRDWFTVLC